MQDGGNSKQQIVEKLKSSTNILVTVSTNPSVDELSAALGLTLILNKMDKHATAVFSGAIPPAIQFLDPEKTFEDTTDSLRDFIIALDKEKADRLRYKVDGDMVRIFITPYRTEITDKDLEFSQGDFNVEVIVALGVEQREELDKAIASHGRILHDATVVTINTKDRESSLGSTDWQDTNASSLCEMLMSLTEALQTGLLDEQIATALLTGIVAATDRFSNDHTKPRVMTMAAQLMAAGANQQLIATKLEHSHVIQPNEKKNIDGSTNLEENASTKVSREEAEKEQVAKEAAKQSDKTGEKQGKEPPKKKANDGEMHIDHVTKEGGGQPLRKPMLDNDAVGMHSEQIEAKHKQDAVNAAENALESALPPALAPPSGQNQPLADLARGLQDERQTQSATGPAVLSDPMPPPPPPPATAPPPPSPAPSAADGTKHELTSEPPSWMGKRIEPPTMGGTLNATSEEALQDKMRSEAEERNHTLLSHSEHPINEEQAPSAAPVMPTPGPSLVPPPPTPGAVPPPPLSPPADIPVPPNTAGQLPPVDTQSPVQPPVSNNLDDARHAVHAALEMRPPSSLVPPAPGQAEASVPALDFSSPVGGMLDYEPTPPPQQPVIPSSQPVPFEQPPSNDQAAGQNSFGAPTPPPLPDMNSLPPLPPNNDPMNAGPAPGSQPGQPDPFGPPPMEPGHDPNDPGQFKIPGQ